MSSPHQAQSASALPGVRSLNTFRRSRLHHWLHVPPASSCRHHRFTLCFHTVTQCWWRPADAIEGAGAMKACVRGKGLDIHGVSFGAHSHLPQCVWRKFPSPIQLTYPMIPLVKCVIALGTFKWLIHTSGLMEEGLGVCVMPLCATIGKVRVGGL